MKIQDQVWTVLGSARSLLKVCPDTNPDDTARVFEEAAETFRRIGSWLHQQAAILAGDICLTFGGHGYIGAGDTCSACKGRGRMPLPSQGQSDPGAGGQRQDGG